MSNYKTPNQKDIMQIVETHIANVNATKEWLDVTEKRLGSHLWFPQWVDADLNVLKIFFPEISEWVEYWLYECGWQYGEATENTVTIDDKITITLKGDDITTLRHLLVKSSLVCY